MKKKILVVETFNKETNEKIDVLSVNPCSGETLLAILQLAPSDSYLKVSFDEIEINPFAPKAKNA